MVAIAHGLERRIHGRGSWIENVSRPAVRVYLPAGTKATEDAQQSMRFARQHAANSGLDPKRIGAVGFSAGGHLASTLATDFHMCCVDKPVETRLFQKVDWLATNGWLNPRTYSP